MPVPAYGTFFRCFFHFFTTLHPESLSFHVISAFLSFLYEGLTIRQLQCRPEHSVANGGDTGM